MNKTKALTTLVTCIALSAVGAWIKIPAVIGSVALDSAPALIGAILLGPIAGGITGALGHILSALLSGLPLGPAHLLIGAEMFILVAGFGLLIQKKQQKAAYLFFCVGNVLIAPLPFIWMMGLPFYMGIVPSLTIAVIVNSTIVVLIAPRLQKWHRKTGIDGHFHA
ncbi:ECF transporter S component [Bacillus sp. 165]|uniref:ECF transporter S component n=1 Tax=Bacillus sp. 165 TaxID=1529117 RepID=UPI001ADC4CD5|nr:ECF transporter S component [Bacillus sp. 165]MBO9128282.1 ECF transporter S component [Bacillus sp. 165]